MEGVHRPCLICGKTETVGRHYGSWSCTACQSFFKRNCEKKNLPLLCTGRPKCTKFTRPCCATCRLQWCYEVGMNRDKFVTRVKYKREKEREREIEPQQEVDHERETEPQQEVDHERDAEPQQEIEHEREVESRQEKYHERGVESQQEIEHEREVESQHEKEYEREIELQDEKELEREVEPQQEKEYQREIELQQGKENERNTESRQEKQYERNTEPKQKIEHKSQSLLKEKQKIFVKEKNMPVARYLRGKRGTPQEKKRLKKKLERLRTLRELKSELKDENVPKKITEITGTAENESVKLSEEKCTVESSYESRDDDGVKKTVTISTQEEIKQLEEGELKEPNVVKKITEVTDTAEEESVKLGEEKCTVESSCQSRDDNGVTKTVTISTQEEIKQLEEGIRSDISGELKEANVKKKITQITDTAENESMKLSEERCTVNSSCQSRDDNGGKKTVTISTQEEIKQLEEGIRSDISGELKEANVMKKITEITDTAENESVKHSEEKCTVKSSCQSRDDNGGEKTVTISMSEEIEQLEVDILSDLPDGTKQVEDGVQLGILEETKQVEQVLPCGEVSVVNQTPKCQAKTKLTESRNVRNNCESHEHVEDKNIIQEKINSVKKSSKSKKRSNCENDKRCEVTTEQNIAKIKDSKKSSKMKESKESLTKVNRGTKRRKTDRGEPDKLKIDIKKKKRLVDDAPSKKSRKSDDSKITENRRATEKIECDLDCLDYEYDSELCDVNSSPFPLPLSSSPSPIENRVLKYLSNNMCYTKLSFDKIILSKEETDLLLGIERTKLRSNSNVTSEDNDGEKEMSTTKETCEGENGDNSFVEDFENSFTISDPDMDEFIADNSTPCESHPLGIPDEVSKKQTELPNEKENELSKCSFNDNDKHPTSENEKKKKKLKTKSSEEMKRSENEPSKSCFNDEDKHPTSENEKKRKKLKAKSSDEMKRSENEPSKSCFNDGDKHPTSENENPNKKLKMKSSEEMKRPEKPIKSLSKRKIHQSVSPKKQEQRRIKIPRESKSVHNSNQSNNNSHNKAQCDQEVDIDVISIMAPDASIFFSTFNDPVVPKIDSEFLNPHLDKRSCGKNRRVLETSSQLRDQQNEYRSSHFEQDHYSLAEVPCKENPGKEVLQLSKINSMFCYLYLLNHGCCPKGKNCPKIHKDIKHLPGADISLYLKYLRDSNNWKEVKSAYDKCKEKLNSVERLELLLTMIKKFVKMEPSRSFRLVCELKTEVPDWVDVKDDELIYNLLHMCTRLTAHDNHLRIQFVDYFCKGSVRPQDTPVNACLLRLKSSNDRSSFWKLLNLCVKWKLELTESSFSLAVKFASEQGDHTQAVIDVFLIMTRNEIKKISQNSIRSFKSSADEFCGSYKRNEIREHLNQLSSTQHLPNSHLSGETHVWNSFLTTDTISESYMNLLIQTIVKNMECAGNKFGDFVTYVKKNLNFGMSIVMKRYLCQVGVVVLLECYEAKVFHQAFKVLQVLHGERTNYFQLQIATNVPECKYITASSIALIAADTCLRVNATESALVILKDSNWILPCRSERRLQRLRFLNSLFVKLLDEEKLENLRLIFVKLLESYKEDVSTLDKNYLQVLDIHAKFDDLIRLILHNDRASLALNILELGRGFSLKLNNDTCRGLLILFHGENFTELVNNHYRLYQQNGVYPLQQSDCTHGLVLHSYYTQEEIYIILEHHLQKLLSRFGKKAIKNFYIRVEEFPIHENESNVAKLRVPADFKSFTDRFSAATESFLPPLVVSAIDVRTIYIDSESLFQYMAQKNWEMLESQ